MGKKRKSKRDEFEQKESGEAGAAESSVEVEGKKKTRFGRSQRFAAEQEQRGASKGVESLVDGVRLSDVAMVASVPLSRARYQAKVMEGSGRWVVPGKLGSMVVVAGGKEKKCRPMYIKPPQAGAAATLTKAAALEMYNLLTTGSWQGESE